MKKRFLRFALGASATAAIVYGGLTVTFPSISVFADNGGGGGPVPPAGTCCNADRDCGGGLNYCNQVGCISGGSSYNGVCNKYH